MLGVKFFVYMLLQLLSVNGNITPETSEIIILEALPVVGTDYSGPIQHLGPTSVASLKLREFFECLSNYTNMSAPIGYKPGPAGVSVNVSMEETLNTTDANVASCLELNDYGLHVLDYLGFVSGVDAQYYTDIAAADSDYTTVYSLIEDSDYLTPSAYFNATYGPDGEQADFVRIP